MKKIFKSDFRVTQAYGVNYDYYKQFGLAGHEGLDIIPVNLNDWAVLSPEGDGEVVKDIDNPKDGGAYGNTITIWYRKLKIALQFCHLAKNFVSIGDKISKGQEIGIMGATGNTNGAHVHLNLFQVDDNGVRLNKSNGFLGGVDPLPYLQAGDDQTIPVLKKDFERIVTKSGYYDKTVEYLSLGNPADTPFEKVQSTIQGYKSRSTDLSNQLTAAQAELKNREEQVARLKGECQESEKLRLDLNSRLNEALKKANEVTGVYEGQLKSKQEVINGLARDKGNLNTQIAALQAENQKLKISTTTGLTISDLFNALAMKFAGK